MRVRTTRNNAPLNHKTSRSTRYSEIHQTWRKIVLLKIHPTRPSGHHLSREKRGLQSTKQDPKFPISLIWSQLIFYGLPVCKIKPNKPMVCFIYSHLQRLKHVRWLKTSHISKKSKPTYSINKYIL